MSIQKCFNIHKVIEVLVHISLLIKDKLYSKKLKYRVNGGRYRQVVAIWSWLLAQV